MKKSIKIFVIISGLVLLSNVPPIRWIVYFGKDHVYSTAQGVIFEELPAFGAPYKNVESNFIKYKYLLADKGDTILYRTFSKNALKFWNWYDYLYHPRYKLPYMNKDEMPKRNEKIYELYRQRYDSLQGINR
ncbi:hypothetical protein [Tellurirhabdus rosea]|uniref:hypothetical protein n=1 Tax=Tellurirhabdus rosea TaxID=2674997 RepID=UPI0022567EB0|nr:hypothetical protein [Tellurirhabdus rosea]